MWLLNDKQHTKSTYYLILTGKYQIKIFEQSSYNFRFSISKTTWCPLAAKDRRGEGVICRVTVAMRLLRSQSRSDCYPILLNMQSHILLNMQSHILLNMQSHIWLNMHSHSREATGTPRLINMQSRSREATVAQSPHFVKYAEPQRSDCYAAPTRRSR